MTNYENAILSHKQKVKLFNSFKVGEKVGVYSSETSDRNPNTNGARHAVIIYKNKYFLTVEYSCFNEYTLKVDTWRESFCVADIRNVIHLNTGRCDA